MLESIEDSANQANAHLSQQTRDVEPCFIVGPVLQTMGQQ